MAYSYTLAERVGNLIAMGREVIIVGDLNIAHLPIDHCGNVNRVTRDEHLSEHPARHWLDQFLAPNGDFTDITRVYHPTRKAMYTCWDTIKDTRPANYGARIDYTLVTKGLLKWIKFADIQPNVYGSDHCPIYVDLRDEIQNEDGSTSKLSDFLLVDSQTKRKVPTLATVCWPEFSGRRLQSFFAAAKPIVKPEFPTVEGSIGNDKEKTPQPSPIRDTSIHMNGKRKASESDASAQAKKVTLPAKKTPPKPSNGQMNIKNFFSKSKSAAAASLEKGQDTYSASEHVPLMSTSAPSLIASVSREEEEDPTAGANRVESALAWGSIFAREYILKGRHF